MPPPLPLSPDILNTLPSAPLPDSQGLRLSEDAAACYQALKTRDARFDGHFFTGVTSTGIYCRPVCSVRAPRPENCRFFELAAQAEQAGFRPCLRCRPELAPQTLAWSSTDARRILAAAAARWLDDPAHWPHPLERAAEPVMTRLARHLGVSDRHLRRVFEASLGVSPLQYLQTRRLLTAKQLLTDTALPVTEVAQASGFASLRRFHAAFAAHYGLNPGQLRKNPATAEGPARALRLAYRPPYDQPSLVRFLAQRAIAGVEHVEADAPGFRLARTLRLPAAQGVAPLCGWLQVEWPPQAAHVRLHCSASLAPALPLLIRRVRQWLDLDADPAAIEQVLAPHFGPLAGLRVPGTLDGFELAVRAILGQQVSVAAGRTLCQRLVERLGPALPAAPDTPAGLSRLFPDAAALAALDPAHSLLSPVLGELGIVRQRQRALLALAHAVQAGRLQLDGSAPLADTLAALTALPGIGDWTAQYIALRALRWPDAFPAGDVVLQNRLGTRQPGRSPRQAALATEAASAAWRPWRGYAVLQLWEHAGTPESMPLPIPPSTAAP